MIRVTPKTDGFQLRSGAFYVYVPHSEVDRLVRELTRDRLPTPHDPTTHIRAVHPREDEPIPELNPEPDYGGFLAARQQEWAAFHERAEAWEQDHQGVA